MQMQRRIDPPDHGAHKPDNVRIRPHLKYFDALPKKNVPAPYCQHRRRREHSTESRLIAIFMQV